MSHSRQTSQELLINLIPELGLDITEPTHIVSSVTNHIQPPSHLRLTLIIEINATNIPTIITSTLSILLFLHIACLSFPNCYP